MVLHSTVGDSRIAPEGWGCYWRVLFKVTGVICANLESVTFARHPKSAPFRLSL